MAQKLSITIAGAVSLGSYESGVAFEVLDALSQHNSWAAQNNPAVRIEIDVFTGASAGGMTVAMVAQRLLFDGTTMNLPYNNRFTTHGFVTSTSQSCWLCQQRITHAFDLFL
jgi:hypothetical protein